MALTWKNIRNGVRATAGDRKYYISRAGTEYQLLFRVGDSMDLIHVAYYRDLDDAKRSADALAKLAKLATN